MNFITDISGYRPKVSQSEIAKIITAETSGTTGKEKRVYYTEEDLERTVEVFMQGISEMEPEKTLVTFPDTGPYSLGERIAEALSRLGAVAINPGKTWSYHKLVDIIFKNKPDSFIGFPQTLLALQRLTNGCFRAGLISGDYCINADYMCPVYPHYGSRETCLAGATSCRCRNGMHMRSDIDVEIIDENGGVLPAGETGELVLTTHLKAMPLECYRTGDYTRIIPGDCSCGNKNVRIDSVSRHTPIEKLDDEMFADPKLIDCEYYVENGEIKKNTVYIDDVSSLTVPFYRGKRILKIM